MDYEKRSSANYAKNLQQLKYKSLPCTTFEIAIFPNNRPIHFKKSTKTGTELLQWIRTGVPKWTSQEDPEYCLRLIIGSRVNERSNIGLLYLPFDQDTFQKIMTHLHLPKSLLEAITEGELHFSHTVNSDWNGVVLRTAPDFFDRHDLALSLASSPKIGVTHALLLGTSDSDLTFNDAKTIELFLSDSRASIGHPKLMFSLVCLLQLDRFRQQDDNIDTGLEVASHKARLNRNTGPEVRASPAMKAKAKAGGNIDYNAITKDVLQLFTEAGFLTQATTQFSKVLDRMVSVIATGDLPSSPTVERIEYHTEHTKYIKEHIEATRDKMISLADNNHLATGRASLLMSSIWNLIAQEESKKTRSLASQSRSLAASSKDIAEDAKRIAAATRRDSTSMKAIAALTMVFLPFTFVASLFSMPFINWNAGPGEKVLSGRKLDYFGIYWATAVHLTTIVLLLWGGWIYFSFRKQKMEDQNLELRRLEVQRQNAKEEDT